MKILDAVTLLAGLLVGVAGLAPAQAADPPVSLGARTENSLSLEVPGKPLDKKTAPDKVEGQVKGAEKSDCEEAGLASSPEDGRASGASGRAQIVVLQHDPLWTTLSLSVGAFANGGHYRTCLAGCIDPKKLKGTSKNSSVRGVSVIDTDNWLSRLTFSAI